MGRRRTSSNWRNTGKGEFNNTNRSVVLVPVLVLVKYQGKYGAKREDYGQPKGLKAQSKRAKDRRREWLCMVLSDALVS